MKGFKIGSVEKLIRERLTHWLPGKKLTNVLKGQGYGFDGNGLVFNETNLGERIHVIMKANTQDLTYPNDRIAKRENKATASCSQIFFVMKYIK